MKVRNLCNISVINLMQTKFMAKKLVDACNLKRPVGTETRDDEAGLNVRVVFANANKKGK